MRLSTTTFRERLVEVNRPVEVQAAVVVEINVQRPEVSRRVENTDISGLHKVVGDDEVLLVRRDLDVVRANTWLNLVRVIQTLDVVQIADVKGGNVVGGGQGEVIETAVLGDIGAVEGNWLAMHSERDESL